VESYKIKQFHYVVAFLTTEKIEAKQAISLCAN